VQHGDTDGEDVQPADELGRDEGVELPVEERGEEVLRCLAGGGLRGGRRAVAPLLLLLLLAGLRVGRRRRRDLRLAGLTLRRLVRAGRGRRHVKSFRFWDLARRG